MSLIHIVFQNSVPNSQKAPRFYHRNFLSVLFTVVFTVVTIRSTQNGRSFHIMAVVRIVTTVFFLKVATKCGLNIRVVMIIICY